MISQGKVNKLMDASTTNRKYKQREGENVTLGSVVSRLKLGSDKMVANKVKKEANSERLRQAGTLHEFSTSREVKDPHAAIFEMKSMRKSLQNHLKNDGHKASCTEGRLKQLSTRKQTRDEPGSSAKSLGRVSNSTAHTEIFTRRIEKEKKCCRKEPRGAPSNSKKEIPSRLNKFTRNVYSRHMAAPTLRITVENDVEDSSEMDLRENSTPIVCSTIKNKTPIIPEIDIDDKSDLENFKCGNEEASFIAGEAEHGVLEPEKISPPEEMSLKDKEVLNKFTDPQLKESLQNIIKTRRTSVRFVRSESGYDIANLEKTICGQQDANDDQYRQEQLEQLSGNDSASEDSQHSDVRIVQLANFRRVSKNHERSTSAGTVISERSHIPTSFLQPRARTRKVARQEKVPTERGITSSRSWVSTTSIQTQRSVISPILRRRKPIIQTLETRVIRPATSKKYIPNLTYKKVPRKQSALSCPEISQHKDKAKNLAQVNMIREFLLMYAKVTTKKDETLPGHMPVRMMSQTPEFVIKSAIGQFLTRAFPSGESEEWSGLGNQWKKEQYEEQQRSKLLRIKICMKHLASVA